MNRLDFRGRVRLAGQWLAGVAVVLLLLAAPLGGAQTGGRGEFDHLRTGFALTGPHASARCETCHQGGTFKGTPRDCASCHVAGQRLARANVVMPPNHLPTQRACDACHRTDTFAGVRFNHVGVVPGSCATCHGAASGRGKPAGHVQTTASCDRCHRTNAWTPATGFDHAGFNAATQCGTCHNGSTATGKGAAHVPVAATNCIVCHTTTSWRPSSFNHTQVTVTAQCATCHNGSFPPADGRGANHVPYNAVPVAAAANCDACHKGSLTTWANGRFHANFNVTTGCFTCHNGAYGAAVGKPANATHATVAGNCESCHGSTTSWSSNVTFAHTPANAVGTGSCDTCHNGSQAKGKHATHVPVTSAVAKCDACHKSQTSWLTAVTMNHPAVVATGCATCHSGAFPPADGRGANHVPYQAVPLAATANCDACHKGSVTTWANGRFHANFNVTTNCFTCHTGAYGSAVGKPANATHATVTGSCESCHGSTTSWTANVTFAHTPANAVGTGSCDTCHNGTSAKGKPNTHIPVTSATAKCDTCHRSQSSWSTAVTMNHTVVTATSCKTCHNGAYVGEGTTGALAKPANHIPEAQLLNGAAMDCNACHTGTTVWTSVRMNHNATPGNGAGWCKACHQSGTSFLGNMEKKSLTHEKSTGVTDCSQSGCHRPLGNKGAAYTKWD